MGFNVRKAAQVVAFFTRERGGSLDVIDAVKLAYLGDRRSMALYDTPILADEFYSMPQGPVGSTTYDLIKGSRTNQQTAIWQRYIKGPKELKLTLTREFSDGDFGELSAADLEILYWVAQKFRKLTLFKLADYLHDNCPEWTDPHGGSALIPYRKIFEALGKKNGVELERRIIEFKNLKAAIEEAK